ncbi:helix-turn-helix domain-containing protein [Streptomyces sp. NPDC093223]|uniref:helix-turn-helix domain-containing protein n=1 Tax=Streptomyces sp. NPDC093223 TaxID=3366033 RepID=UPI0037F6AC57
MRAIQPYSVHRHRGAGRVASGGGRPVRGAEADGPGRADPTDRWSAGPEVLQYCAWVTQVRSGLTLELTESQRAHLLSQVNGSSTPQARVVRCLIVLAVADGEARSDVARRYAVSAATVDKWIGRYAAEGAAGLQDRPRPGAPRRIGDTTIADLLYITSHEPPPGGGTWSKRTLARRAGVSASTVARIWRAHGITPGAGGSPAALDPGEATPPPVVARAIYVNEALSVLACRGTMNPMAAPGGTRFRPDSRPPEPPGTPDCGARRFSVVRSALAAVAERKPSSGGRATPGFTTFLHRLATTRPTDTDLHVICHVGNSATLLALHRWQFEQSRLHVHLTPTHEVWLQVLQDVLTRMSSHSPGTTAPHGLPSIDAALREWRPVRRAEPFIWDGDAEAESAS